VTPLRQHMLEELQRRNYTTDTIRGYLLAVEQFARYFRKSPELLGAEEIAQFQLHLLREQKLAVGTIALRMGALRFLYKKTLKRRDLDFDDLPLLKKPKKLPVVLRVRGGPLEGERHRPLAHVDPRPAGQGIARP
jgi:integrase/recombinase XerD